MGRVPELPPGGGLRRLQCFLSVLAPGLAWPGHVVLPSCWDLSWSSEARVPRVPAPAPLGAAQGSVAWPPNRAPDGALGGSWQCFRSASLTPPCTLCAGPVVSVCLVFLYADRCTGSEVCHVGFVGTSRKGLRNGPESSQGRVWAARPSLEEGLGPLLRGRGVLPLHPAEPGQEQTSSPGSPLLPVSCPTASPLLIMGKRGDPAELPGLRGDRGRYTKPLFPEKKLLEKK